jgi:thioredoxin:protein disulfide reductase
MCLALIASACSKATVNNSNQPSATSEGAPKVTSVGVVKATPAGTDIPVGDSGEATVRLNIDPGYHVNANPPSYPYLKPTEVEITGSDGLSVSFITYPNAISRKFAFAEKPLAVYEGEITIKVRLKADKSAKPGSRNLSAKLLVQACDEQVCYAPGTINMAIPVSIK